MTSNYSSLYTCTAAALMMTIGFTWIMLMIKLVTYLRSDLYEPLPWLAVLLGPMLLGAIIALVLILFLIGAILHKFKS